VNFDYNELCFAKTSVIANMFPCSALPKCVIGPSVVADCGLTNSFRRSQCVVVNRGLLNYNKLVTLFPPRFLFCNNSSSTDAVWVNMWIELKRVNSHCTISITLASIFLELFPFVPWPSDVPRLSLASLLNHQSWYYAEYNYKLKHAFDMSSLYHSKPNTISRYNKSIGCKRQWKAFLWNEYL